MPLEEDEVGGPYVRELTVGSHPPSSRVPWARVCDKKSGVAPGHRLLMCRGVRKQFRAYR